MSDLSLRLSPDARDVYPVLNEIKPSVDRTLEDRSIDNKYRESATNATNCHFSDGNVNNNNKTNNNNARCVRLNAKSLKNPLSIYRAYLDCRKHKRSTANAIVFERDFSSNLYNLTKEIQNGTWAPTRSLCFVVRNPKPREVFAADFRDRIVHHLLTRFLEPYWERVFIYDSFACRKDKGTLAAVKRLHHFMLSATENGKKRAYFLQLDVKNFFMSINKDILWSLVKRGLMKQKGVCGDDFKTALWLAKTIIYNDPTLNHINKSSAREWAAVPKEKSLFYAPKNKGIPIGNLTSQFFANVYLNELDQYVKHVLKVKYYIRYVDDFIIIDRDKNKLIALYSVIKRFLKEKLDLTLKSSVKLAGLSCGINFLGYIQHIFYRLQRRRVSGNLKSKLYTYNNKRLRLDDLFKIRAFLNSYLAHCKEALSFRLLEKILSKNNWLFKYFSIYKYVASIDRKFLTRKKISILCDTYRNLWRGTWKNSQMTASL